MIDELALTSKIDIPFPEAELIIHQPSILEISYIGEQNFWKGCQYLAFSKDLLKSQDKIKLAQLSDFEVLMKIMQQDDVSIKQIKVCMQLVLLLLFPDYNIALTPMSIILSKPDENNNIERKMIDKENFSAFKENIESIFCMKSFLKGTKKYNPGGPQAAALVQKFQQRQRKLSKLKQKSGKQHTSIFSQYLLILSVGEQKDMNELLKYSVYQLLREFRRFKLKYNFDMYFQAKMAGAKNLEEIQNWTNPTEDLDD